MKKNVPLLFTMVLLLQCLTSLAQKRYFIYIQSETHQPFYVVINNKTYSSSSSGYLVIPRLRSGKQFFSLGFIKQEAPEQKFICTIASTDLGFSLKTFGSKGWGLFNLQDFSVVMANPKDWDIAKEENDQLPVEEETDVDVAVNVSESDQKIQAVPTSSNAISEKKNVLITTASKDERTKQNQKIEIAKEESQDIKAANNTKNLLKGINSASIVVSESQTKTDQEVRSGSFMVQNSKDPANGSSAKAVSNNTVANAKKMITKKHEQAISAGVDLVYIDYTDVKSDTVNVFIPYGFQQTVKNVLYNSGCVQLATEFDYNKLRRSMAEETADKKMIDVALKAFKARCYTSEQIKNLSLLFISDAGRYNFYSAAYPTVYDFVNYSSLEQNLHSDEYKQKFRLLLGY